jgi:hypothetical protein
VNALITLNTVLPGALTTAEIDATMTYAEAEKALATRGGLCLGLAGCALRRATPLPAHVGIVAAYLSWLQDSGRKSSTFGLRAIAIGYRHKIAGHEPPTNREGVRAVLRGIRRTIGSARQGKVPATADLIGQMVALCPDNMCRSFRQNGQASKSFARDGAFQHRSRHVAIIEQHMTGIYKDHHKSLDTLHGYVRRG